MNIVSLFSGAGGLDLGLIQSGQRVIWANDIDRDAVETYRRNIGYHVHLSDISKIPASEIPSCDVVVGGFPCQGFSLANLQRGERDERNRLYLEFLRVVREKQPSYFLAENVRGILSLGGGRVIEQIETDFAKAGYRVRKQLFNVADYGVPQTRYRVIIAGTRNDLPSSLNFEFPEPTHAVPRNAGKLGKKPWVSIGEALVNVPDPGISPSLPNHIFSLYKVTNRK